MKYSAARITAAAHVIHNNYSEVDMFEATTGELQWAEGTARAVAERLGRSEEHEADRARLLEARAVNLSLQEALTKVWEVAGRDSVEGFGGGAEQVPQAVAEAIEAARAPQGRIEVNEDMISALIASIYPSNVVADRQLVRSGLANALQTR